MIGETNALEMQIRSCPHPTALAVWMKNRSSSSLCVAAPNPYTSIVIADLDHKPYAGTRAVRYEYSRKVVQMEPGEELIATIDLLPYWSEICGAVLVRVSFEVTDDVGVSREMSVQGRLQLDIPSLEVRYAEIKKHARSQGLPFKLLDVADSTWFDRVCNTT